MTSIPLPSSVLYPFKFMGVGDSFEVPVIEGVSIRQQRSRASTYMAIYTRKNPEYQFTIRYVNKKIRIWRTGIVKGKQPAPRQDDKWTGFKVERAIPIPEPALKVKYKFRKMKLFDVDLIKVPEAVYVFDFYYNVYTAGYMHMRRSGKGTEFKFSYAKNPGYITIVRVK
jgi:hypothetical protein